MNVPINGHQECSTPSKEVLGIAADNGCGGHQSGMYFVRVLYAGYDRRSGGANEAGKGESDISYSIFPIQRNGDRDYFVRIVYYGRHYLSDGSRHAYRGGSFLFEYVESCPPSHFFQLFPRQSHILSKLGR